MGEVCLSPALQVALVPVIGFIVSLVGFLYRDAVKSRNDQIADLIEQRDALMTRVMQGTGVVKQARGALEEAAGGRRSRR